MQHSFGKNGANGQFTADLDLGRFRRDFTNQLLTVVALSTKSTPPPPANLLTNQPTTVDMLTAKADYSRPLGPVWKIETGLKSATVRTDNDLTIAFGEVQGLPVKSMSAALKVKFTVQDMFHSNRIIQTTSLPGNRQVTLLTFDTRIALLNINYSFGNQKVKTATSRRSGSEDESRRAN